jgi:uncharacterized protein (DUF1501 family)
MSTTRREFCIGCSAAVAAMAGGRLTGVSFADLSGSALSGDVAARRGILLVLFLRGGADGLSLIAPVDDPAYVAARGAAMRVTDRGDNAGLPLKGAPARFEFRLHPKAAPLHELYASNQLAIVHACGLTNGTRSHFDAMDLIERGVADQQHRNLASGWLSRYLTGMPESGPLPAVAAGGSLPDSLLGSSSAVAMPDATAFAFHGDERQAASLRTCYTGDVTLHRSARAALDAIPVVWSRIPMNDKGEPRAYRPSNGARYPEGELGGALQTVARLIKMEVGLQVATVDYGGWDTHESQIYIFPALVEELSRSLAAFYNDVSAYHRRLSVVVLSEFGRRLKANESGGTDHGHGNVMLVLGGNVNGGRIYGAWPGLETEQLDSRADLAVTTDYRTVISELLEKRMGRGDVSSVFPGFSTASRLGIVRA